MPYRLRVLAQQAGFRGLFAGLGPRMIMTAGLVAGQFLMYGAIKDGESPVILGTLAGMLSLVCSPGRPARLGDS